MILVDYTVIDDKTPDAALDAMGRAGIRGIRLNLATSGINDPVVGRARFTAALARPAARLGSRSGDAEDDPGRQSGAAVRLALRAN